MERSLAQERLFATLSSLFGLLALVLVTVGLYGVMAYSMSRRVREIGVRMALGAGKSNIISLVMSHGMNVVLIGLTLGWIGAFGLVRIVESRLYGITTNDPLVLASVSLLRFRLALRARPANLF